jgi:hypothetical protein
MSNTSATGQTGVCDQTETVKGKSTTTLPKIENKGAKVAFANSQDSKPYD